MFKNLLLLSLLLPGKAWCMDDRGTGPVKRLASTLGGLESESQKSRSVAAKEVVGKALKKFTCVTCNKEFGYKGNLTVHLKTHTGERPFQCDYPGCNKAFTRRFYLREHVRVHKEERPFQCDHPGCGMTFRQKSSLVIHMRVHKEERPFQCDHPGCGMAFKHNGNLTAHMRLHTGECPFECDYPSCGMAFKRKSSLVEHNNRHVGDFLYKCTECDKWFACNGSLYSHTRRKHRSTPASVGPGLPDDPVYAPEDSMDSDTELPSDLEDGD